MRAVTATNQELAQKLEELERRIAGHDEKIQTIFEAIRQLMTPLDGPRKNIGFEVKEPRARYGRLRRGTVK